MIRLFAVRASLCAVACLIGMAAAGAQTYDDGHGREWRQPPATINLSWDEIASVCPTDGVTPGSGVVGGVDFTGWTWATPDQVALLLSYFEPAVLTDPCIGGSQYVLGGIILLGGGYIDPTFAFYSTFGASLYVAGWTSATDESGAGIIGSASGEYPVFYGSFCVTGAADPASRSIYTGAWLWRPTVEGDINGDGVVDLSDLGVLLSKYGMTVGATRADGDFDGDGDVDLSDLGVLLANYGCC